MFFSSRAIYLENWEILACADLAAHARLKGEKMEEPIAICPQCGTKNRLKAAPPDQTPICGKCKGLLPWIVEGTDISFRKELETSTPVLVDFWAEWCAPCRMTAPALEALARDKAGQIKILKVNVDQNPTTAGQFNVRSIPTMMLFKDGNPVETLVGAMSKEALLQRLGSYLV
jgi:thioredoxin 2